MAEINNDEKEQYTVGHETPDHDIRQIVNQKGAAYGEAADVYGNVETAERYGYVERGYASYPVVAVTHGLISRRLKSRHIQFIALGGTIGTGLFLGIGNAFANVCL
jgi:amino acid transporter